MKRDPSEVHQKYLEVLRRLGPERRLRKAFELTEMARELFRAGLQRRFPELSDDQRHRLYLEGLAKCHDRID